jgi:hypothetical protein
MLWRLGTFSLVTLQANSHTFKRQIPILQDTWYCKPLPTLWVFCARETGIVAPSLFSAISETI